MKPVRGPSQPYLTRPDPTSLLAYLTTRTVECQVLNVDEQFCTVLFKTDLDQPVRPSDKRMADRCL